MLNLSIGSFCFFALRPHLGQDLPGRGTQPRGVNQVLGWGHGGLDHDVANRDGHSDVRKTHAPNGADPLLHGQPSHWPRCCAWCSNINAKPRALKPLLALILLSQNVDGRERAVNASVSAVALKRDRGCQGPHPSSHRQALPYVVEKSAYR